MLPVWATVGRWKLGKTEGREYVNKKVQTKKNKFSDEYNLLKYTNIKILRKVGKNSLPVIPIGFSLNCFLRRGLSIERVLCRH